MANYKKIPLPVARSLAMKAQTVLNGMNGDPAKNASWIRERQLADIVIALLDRIDDVTEQPIEVRE